MLSILLVLNILACGDNHDKEYASSLPDKVDFNYHIKPILSDRCFACHGPDKNALKAGLQLNIKEGALEKVLESGGFAFIPGNVDKSEAFQRMTSTDPEVQMPPPESGLSMTPYEMAMIAKWIDQGAEYKPHWSYITPRIPSLPVVKNTQWVRNPIDNFVLDKLENQKKAPNQEADKETLLRRVTLDLTGLPPTIKEIDDFLLDGSAVAYEKVVDRLLNSQHYGERMAVEWLDISRYADSHGYSTDGYRLMWPWRDWVINAYNKNMPFDRFLTWQIAGDKIPNATKEQKLATAFLRNQKLNAEGGIVQEEYMVEYAADRTETVSTVFLGLTMQCARCHDHKYDAITQKEYYQFFSFFNNVNERGMTQNDGNSGPQVMLTTKEVENLISYISTSIDSLEVSYTDTSRPIEKQLYSNPTLDLEKDLIMDLGFDHQVNSKFNQQNNLNVSFSLPGRDQLVQGKNGKGLKFSGYDVMNINSQKLNFDRADTFSFSFWIQSHHENQYMPLLFRLGGKNTGYRGYEVAIINGYPTIRLSHGLPANLISVRTDGKLTKGEWVHLTMVYDGSGSATGIKIYENGEKTDTTVLFDQLSKSFATNGNSLAIGGRQDYQEDIKGYAIMDDLKIYGRVLSELETYAIYSGQKMVATEFSEETLKSHYYLTANGEHKSIRHKIQSLRKEKNQILDTVPTVMIMQDLETPRETHILDRGMYDAPGEVVRPGTPESVLPFSNEFSKDRLGLAKWLVDKRNPLTARVAVNRYWQLYFGQGIVKTIEDFGNQGAMPHHPELLDYLAATFKESGWDVKKIQKLIVMSATYRQSSRVTEQQRLLDPENVLLGRGPNRRLQAEFIRDCALAASGLLVDRIGGESVKPYQPLGLWEEITGNSNILDTYRQDSGEQLYRRSIYTFWRRASPPPTMAIFDAPSRDYCIVRRQETNTPLQALALLNDPQFVEAARVLAERVISEKSTVNDQILLAYRLLTGIKPDSKVMELLGRHYLEQKEHFSQNPKLATELLAIGEWVVVEELSPIEVSAMTVVCNNIMNFDETIVKR